MIISDAKRAANRANAQHSTSPRTPEGKAAVSRNAQSHGLYGADLPFAAGGYGPIATRQMPSMV